jgi:hypothetical protein
MAVHHDVCSKARAGECDGAADVWPEPVISAVRQASGLVGSVNVGLPS